MNCDAIDSLWQNPVLEIGMEKDMLALNMGEEISKLSVN